MSWSLKGSYVETCSCELMCPCNTSFDHGATYDYCRVTLVFNIREGEVDGTDVGGLTVAAIADTPKVMTEGNWRLGRVRRRPRDGRAAGQARRRLQRAARRADGRPRSARRRDARRRAGADRGRATTACGTASGSATRSTSRSRTSSPSASRRASRSGSTACSTRPGPTSRWRRRSARGSTPSGSSTRARPGSRRPSSPGPPERVIAAAHERALRGEGSRPRSRPCAVRLGLVALLFALAAVGWWWTVGQMQGMDDGPWTDLGALGWFVGVWVVMMAAMMFPSVSPTVALYSRMTRERSPLSPLLFTAGYLATWTAAGVLAFADRAGGRTDRRRRALLGPRGPLDRRRDAAGRGRLRADAAQGRLPRQVPQPARLPARLLARRPVRRAADGREERRLVRRLLLGADGVAVRARRHEHRVDGVRRRPDRGREDSPVAPRRRRTGRPRSSSRSGVLLLVAPEAIPALTIPGGMMSPAMS